MIFVMLVDFSFEKIKVVGRYSCTCIDGILRDLISKVVEDFCFLNIFYFGLELKYLFRL